jgi:hypothetical protein
MQNKNERILSSEDKIEGFQGKLKFWLDHIASGSTDMFPTVCLFSTDNALLSVIDDHLNSLQKKFKEYFIEVVSKIWYGFVIHLVLSELHFLWKSKRN